MVREFDLNIEKILANWEVYHAIREIIANALDEQILTNTKQITITEQKGSWHIIDYGRGLNYHHLTQNESQEKLNDDRLIGRFGVGLKDALATLHRHGIKVRIESRYGIITLKQSSKADFSDIITLHAQIDEPVHPHMDGTDFKLTGCTEEDVTKAKRLFLAYNQETVLAQTPYGQILKKQDSNVSASIYINGVKVSEEPNFLFSYNITSLTATLKKALNRERTNVGRSAYSDRVKSILLSCTDEKIAQMLCDDLKDMSIGSQCDEIKWADIESHAVKLLNHRENTVFVTPEELKHTSANALKAVTDSGREIIFVTEKAKEKAVKEDSSVSTIESVVQDYNNSFEYHFIAYEDLNKIEQRNLQDLKQLLTVLDLESWFDTIEISEKLRVNTYGEDILGVWDSNLKQIVIRRDQLSDYKSLFGVALHEITHATSGYTDVTRGFESALTRLIGEMGDKIRQLEVEIAALKSSGDSGDTSAAAMENPIESTKDSSDYESDRSQSDSASSEWVTWKHMYAVGYYDDKGNPLFTASPEADYSINLKSKTVTVYSDKAYDALLTSDYFTLADIIFIDDAGCHLLSLNNLCCRDLHSIGSMSAKSIPAPVMEASTQYLECVVRKRENGKYLQEIVADIVGIVHDDILDDDDGEIDLEKLFDMTFIPVKDAQNK